MVDDVWEPPEIQNYRILCRVYRPYQPRGVGVSTLLSRTSDTSVSLCPAYRSGNEKVRGSPAILICGFWHTGAPGISYGYSRVWHPAWTNRRLPDWVYLRCTFGRTCL